MRPWMAVACRVCGALAMGAILLAGIGKAMGLTAFEQSLASWHVIPPGWTHAVSIAVPAVEIAAGIAWFAGIERRAAISAAGTLIATATALYAWQLATSEPPDCACFGLLLEFEHRQDQAAWVLGRNAIILGLMVAAIAPGLVRRGKPG